MRLNSLRVIIIGGATGGCAAALLLARAGARVTLCERIAQPHTVGAGIGLASNGLAVLESIGLGPALRVARPVLGGLVSNAAGRPLLRPPASAPLMHMLRRETLQRILLDAVSAEPLVETRFGTTLVEARPDGTVTVRRDGADHDEVIEADLVVGADGVHSRVREGGRFGATVRRSGLHYLRALLPAGLGQQREVWTSAGILGSFEVDDGTYLYASCNTPRLRAAVRGCDVDVLRATWRDAYAASAPLFDTIDRWQSLLVHEVTEVRCRRWWHGTLVLLGDAAHAMAPNLGQGANSALVDAAVLLHELRRAETLAEGLEAYARRRRPRVHAVARSAAALGRIGEWTGPVARGIRDRAILPVLNAMTTTGTLRRVLQEDATVLREIGRMQPAY